MTRLALLAAFLAPACVAAQTVHGRVVGADSVQGIAGTVVQLVDAAGHDVARTISDETGTFTLRAPSAGSYAVRTLRIGFAPGSFGPYDVAIGGRPDVLLVLRGLPAQLSAIHVTGRNECRVRAESGPEALALWEQARTALLATIISREQRRMTVTTVSYLRVTEGTGDRTTRLQMARRTGEAVRPFVAARTADEYVEAGYERRDATGSTMYSPDADVLLAESFGAWHCFRIDPASDDHRDEVGLAFEPIPQRKAPVDVAGTLWLGRGDGALRRLEYRYVGTEYPEEVEPHGRVEFARLANGLWVIPRWTIDIPRVQVTARRGLDARGTVTVTDVWRSGGLLVDARVDSAVLWTGTTGRISGRVAEEKTGLPVSGAIVSLEGTDYGAVTDSSGVFALDGVLAGGYIVQVRSPAAEAFGLGAARGMPVTVRDSATATLDLRAPAASRALDRACGRPLAADRRSMLTGVVRDSSGAPVRGAIVTAQWLDQVDVHAAGLTASTVSATATTDADGRYRVCGVVRQRPLTVTATAPAGTASTVVRLDPGDLLGVAELRLKR